MLLTLKGMDNLQEIECHQRICHLFLIFKLTCYKFVALKENTLTLFKISTVSRPSTLLRVFDMGRLVCPAKGECGSHCGGLPANPKVSTFSFSWISRWPKIKSPCPSLDHRPHIGKKVPRLTNFTSNVTCGIYFQSHNHDWFEKAHWN